jgi:hypothetical protein
MLAFGAVRAMPAFDGMDKTAYLDRPSKPIISPSARVADEFAQFRIRHA